MKPRLRSGSREPLIEIFEFNSLTNDRNDGVAEFDGIQHLAMVSWWWGAAVPSGATVRGTGGLSGTGTLEPGEVQDSAVRYAPY